MAVDYDGLKLLAELNGHSNVRTNRGHLERWNYVSGLGILFIISMIF